MLGPRKPKGACSSRLPAETHRCACFRTPRGARGLPRGTSFPAHIRFLNGRSPSRSIRPRAPDGHASDPFLPSARIPDAGAKASPPAVRPGSSAHAPHTHPAPPAGLVEAVRSRYPQWADLSVDSVRAARQHPLSWLLKQIEDIYDARYAHDVAELEAMAGADPDELDDEATRTLPFPAFVKNWCGRQYGVRALAEKAAWEVMCNAEAARSAGQHASVDVFCAFCNRGYDDEELLFFLYCRQTLLAECAKAVKPAEGGKSDAGRRFVLGAATVSSAPSVTMNETSVQHVTRLVFGSGAGGRGMLYQAVLQLIGEYFDEKREAMREERKLAASRRASQRRGSKAGANPPPSPPKPREATMDAYYYLKLMLSAYRDTRPDRDGSEASEGGAGGLEFGKLGFDDPDDADRADDETFEEDPGHFDDDAPLDPEPEESAERARERRRGASGDRARREEAVFSSRDVSATGPTRVGDGDGDGDRDAPDSPGGRVGASPSKSQASRMSSGSRGSPPRPFPANPGAPPRAPPSPVPPLDPRGASVRLVRRAITDSCSKYCDVLLQVAQDLAPEVLAELKRKAVLSLDGRSQALFSGALAAAFGSDLDLGSPGGDAATKVAGREPDVVAAVAKSLTALLRDSRASGSGVGGDQESGEKKKTGSGEAREIARVVLASRTIRSHVEPMLASLLSELDDDEEAYESEDGASGSEAEGTGTGAVGGGGDESGDEGESTEA
mgnify:CR=1 FL=1